MYGFFWLLFAGILCMLPYLILNQKFKALLQTQQRLIAQVQRLEQLNQPQLTQQTSQHIVPRPAPISEHATIQQPVTAAGVAPIYSADLTTQRPTPPPLPIAVVAAPQTEPNPRTEHRTAPTVTRHRPATLEPDERSLSIITSVWATLSSWFTGGNTIVRVGVITLLIGVSLLLRLLNERIDLPIEVWLSLISLGGVLLTGLGLRLKNSRRGYALSLQGAGLAVLYLSGFSAYYLYHLLSSGLTFALLAILAAVTTVLSLRQDALPLALLGFGAAFLAPILTSSDQGQVVLLFSYYLLINLAVAWIAHQRTWKILNLFGASTTFGIATFWGWQSFNPDLRWAMEGLLIAHVALYVFIVVRYSQLLEQQSIPQPKTQPTAQILNVDTGLLFGVPLVAFGLQAGLLHDVPYGLAISSAVLAAGYLGLGYTLQQRNAAPLVLREGIFALGLGFLALSLPLALNAHWTSTGWMIQGVALVWVGSRQHRRWHVLFGLALQALSLLILIWLAIVRTTPALGLEQLIACITFLVSAALLRQPQDQSPRQVRQPQSMQAPASGRLSSISLIVLSGLIGVWWLQQRWLDLDWLSNGWPLHTASQLIWDLGILGLLGLLLGLWINWAEMRWVIRRLVLLMGAGLVGLLGQHLFDHSGRLDSLLMATLAWLGLLLWTWRQFDIQQPEQSLRKDQAWGLAMTLLLLSGWSFHLYENAVALVLLPIALLLCLQALPLQKRLPDWLPLQHSQQDIYPIFAFGLAVWVLWANIESSGQFAHLAYIPVLNLLDGCLLAVGFWGYRGLTEHEPRLNNEHRPIGHLILGGLAFWSLSGLVVRSLHQWVGTPLWPMAWHNDTVQTSLTIVWSSSALLITLLASRRGWRPFWWVGIGLLGLVMTKLMLVDLSNLSAVARVISFIGAGGVMLVMGYVAPLPPEQRLEQSPENLPKNPSNDEDNDPAKPSV